MEVEFYVRANGINVSLWILVQARFVFRKNIREDKCDN